MASLFRFRANWTGFVGSPGYSIFHARTFAENLSSSQDVADALGAFFFSFRQFLPSNTDISIDPEVPIIEDTTGVLQNVTTIVPPAVAEGTATGAYSAASGGVVNWSTSTIRNGRRMRGRTFLVPMGSTAFDTSGSIGTTVLTTINASAATLLTAFGVELVVYGRPTLPGAADGVSGDIISGRMPDLAAVLRSRRD